MPDPHPPTVPRWLVRNGLQKEPVTTERPGSAVAKVTPDSLRPHPFVVAHLLKLCH